jgi:hypothetical protein
VSNETTSRRGNFCSQCGTPTKNPRAKFCGACGQPLRRQSEPTKDPNIEGPDQIPPTDQQQPIQPQSTQNGLEKPQYVPGVDPRRSPSESIQYPPPMQSSPYYSQLPGAVPQQSRFITPSQISSIQARMFSREETYLIILFTSFGFLSHFMRFLLMYNRFPSILEFLVPLPFYFIAIFIIFFVYKKSLLDSGVMTEMEADYYDHTVSFVLSTFFASTISYRSKIDQELTSVPDNVDVPKSTKYGLTYEKIPKMAYIGGHILPRAYLIQTLIASLVATICLFVYFEASSQIMITTFRLLSAYIGGYAVMEIAPWFGRHNEAMTKIGRYRTLLLFLYALVITIFALFGESFFVALKNR